MVQIMKKMQAVILALVFVIAAVLAAGAFCSQAAYAEDAHTHNGITFQPWTSDDSLPSEKNKKYYLTKDVILTKSWEPPVNSTTDLCLNGHGIIFKGEKSVIYVYDSSKSNVHLNIYDCGSTTHYYTPAEGGAGLATGINDTAGTGSFSGGYITGGRNADTGGGIMIVNGTVTLNGGTIIGNSANSQGGGVYVVNTGSFTMTGGAIIGNYVNSLGGGVYANGDFTMTGGLISENESVLKGGGVYCTGNNMSVSNRPRVNLNKGDGGWNDIHLNYDCRINVTGELNADSFIAVKMNKPGVFTSGLITNGGLSDDKFTVVFKSDDPDYEVVRDGNEAKLQLLPPAEITEDPETNDRFYDGKEKPLLKTAGKAEGGTLEYAVGDSGSAPKSGWSTSIPTGQDQKYYYVWVRAAGDETHSDSEPKCYVSKIVFPVTFKVKNGKWSDEKGGTADRVVALDRYDNEDLLLRLEPGDIPEVGNDPDKGYTEGSWDETPSTEMAISGEKTFTYSYKVIPIKDIDNITPADPTADNAKVDRSIPKVDTGRILTVGNFRKKQMKIVFPVSKKAINYRVQYRQAGKKKWISAWSKGTDTYVIKNLKRYSLTEFRIAGYVKQKDGSWVRGNWSDISYRYMNSVKFKTVKSGKKKITLKWTKDKRSNGYQIHYSLKKSMSGMKNIKVNGKAKTKYTIKKLKKKTYYVRIRPVKKKYGKTYLGVLTGVRKVKVK